MAQLTMPLLVIQYINFKRSLVWFTYSDRIICCNIGGTCLAEYYYTYGLEDKNIEQVRYNIEAALGIQMVAHDSTYWGGLYYRYGTVGDESVVLRNNYNSFDGEYAESDHHEYELLLHINKPYSLGDIEAKLKQSLSTVHLLKKIAI
jgi:hypothetical protein